MKRTVIAIMMGVVLLFSACGSAKTKTTDPKPQTNDPSPQTEDSQAEEGIFSSFTTKDLDGNIIDQDILKGKKLTIVNVWATFCGPCLREMPELEKLSEEMADRGVQVVGIVSDITDRNYQVNGDLLRQAKEIVSLTGVSFPSLIPCRDLATFSSIQIYPTTFFVDENGRQIGDVYIGARDQESWRALVEIALKEIP